MTELVKVPEWKPVPDAPGIWLKAYMTTIQGWDEFVLSAIGIEMRRVPGVVFDQAWEGSMWYGPIPTPPPSTGDGE